MTPDALLLQRRRIERVRDLLGQLHAPLRQRRLEVRRLLRLRAADGLEVDVTEHPRL